MSLEWLILIAFICTTVQESFEIECPYMHLELLFLMSFIEETFENPYH